MVLAVDYMDKEEHLSLICDFAKAKNVKDSEMKDIAQMVRLVFHEETEGFLVSSKVSICFEKILDIRKSQFHQRKKGFYVWEAL